MDVYFQKEKVRHVMNKRNYRVGILGATGMVGQRLVMLLNNHPWFHITVLAASERSAGLTYSKAVHNRWKMEEEIPESIKDMMVESALDIDSIRDKVDFVFCAVDMKKNEIADLEEAYAKAEIPVVSNNSAHRWTPDVPMIIPEINGDHLRILETQKRRLGTKRGFIVVKPNCSIQSYTPLLYALKEYGPKEVVATTYQAISGSGKNFETWPEMIGNVIPYIAGEEEKSEKEPLRILGEYRDGQIIPETLPVITTQCIRVPVLDGHMAAVFVNFEKKPSREDILRCWREYQGLPQLKNLPSAPAHFLVYKEDDNRPQVTLDVMEGNGMSIVAGRLREDTLYDYKFIGLSHNTLRGAAGGSVLTAELLCEEGFFDIE